MKAAPYSRLCVGAASILPYQPVLLLFSQTQNLINDPILLCFSGAHEEVAIGVAPDTLKGLSRMVMDDVVEDITQLQNLASMNINIGRLATQSTLQWLVHVNTSVRQGTTQTTITGHEENSAKAGCVANTGRCYRTRHNTHSVIDAQASIDSPAR